MIAKHSERSLPPDQQRGTWPVVNITPTRSDRWQAIMRNQDKELLWGLLCGLCLLVSVLGMLTILLGI